MMGESEVNVDNVEPLFKDLVIAESEPEVTEITSLCLNCRNDGITKLLLTKIPFYKDVVIMSFDCPHCHWQNNELQPASIIQEKGVLYKLKVVEPKDLNRQVVKTNWSSVVIPELDFEIPAQSQEGMITNIEGILQRAIDALHPKLKEASELQDSITKLKEFVIRLEHLKEVEDPYHFILRDISGNSFLENTYAPKIDPNLEILQFERSRDENIMLGIFNEEEEHDENEEENIANEVLEFATNCFSCNAPCVTNMKVINIPHFKEVVVMATNCELCGNKTNEVQSSSGIEPLGVKISLKISEEEDMKRDLLKSDTCSIRIPELEFDIGPSAFKSSYTTVEGLILKLKDLIQNNPFVIGDSAQIELKEKLENFVHMLDEVVEAKRPVTLILDDPCGHSYMQSIYCSDVDKKLTVEKYERSYEQNEELGLNNMKVENYEET